MPLKQNKDNAIKKYTKIICIVAAVFKTVADNSAGFRYYDFVNAGSQFTSKAFVEFCESVHVTQSTSKAGSPYDNAPMERYFHTLKDDCTNLYEYDDEDVLYQAVEEFAYVEYNTRSSFTFFRRRLIRIS